MLSYAHMPAGLAFVICRAFPAGAMQITDAAQSAGCHWIDLTAMAISAELVIDVLQIGKGRSVYKLNRDTLERTKVADVPTPEALSPSWVHDFPFTENYLIIPDTPLKFNIPVRLPTHAQRI